MRGYTTIYSDECLSAYTRHEQHFITLLYQMDRVDKFSATSPSLELPAGTIHVLHMHITCHFPSGFECQQPRIRKDKSPMHQKYANFRPKGMLILEVIFWNEEQFTHRHQQTCYPSGRLLSVECINTGGRSAS